MNYPEIVNATTLAKLLGVETRRVQQLYHEGVAVRVKRGKYKLHESVQNYVAMKESSSKGNADEGYSDPIKDLKYKRDLMEYQKEIGKLENVEELSLKMQALGIKLKKSVLSVADRAAPKLATEKKAGKIRAYLLDELTIALRELKNASG